MPALQDLSAEQLTGSSAVELIEALGGLSEITTIQDGLASPAIKAKHAAMPKVPVMIPTPDSWQAPFPFTQSFCIDDVKYEITGDMLTMVPQVVFEVWRNKVDGESLQRQHRANAKKRMSYTNIEQVPVY